MKSYQRILKVNIRAKNSTESNIMESNSCYCLASSSWCSAPTLDMGTQYLQVDLLSVHVLSGFSTQGAVTENFWVSRYHARYSLDGTDWILIEGHEGRIKVTLREFYVQLPNS